MADEFWIQLKVYEPFRLGGTHGHYKYRVKGEVFKVGGLEWVVFEQSDGTWAVAERSSGGRAMTAGSKEELLGQLAVGLSETPDFAEQLAEQPKLESLPEMSVEDAERKLKIRPLPAEGGTHNSGVKTKEMV